MYLRTGQGPDDRRRIPGGHSAAQRTLCREPRDEPPHVVVSKLVHATAERSDLGIDCGRAAHDLVDWRCAFLDLGNVSGKPGDLPLLGGFGTDLLRPRAVQERDRRIIPAHPDIQELVKQPCLGPKGRVDRVGRHSRLGGDGLHRRRGVAALGEQALGRVEDAQPRLAGLLLSQRRCVWALGLDSWHWFSLDSEY